MRSCHFIALWVAVLFGVTGCERTEKALSPKSAVQPDAAKARTGGDILTAALPEQTTASLAPKPANAAAARAEPAEYADRTRQFLEAAEKGRISLLLEFLKQGTDVNDKDDDGQTALHKAVAGGHRSAVIALLTHGADMGERDAKGRTSLMAAAENGHAELVLILVNPDKVKNLAGEALQSVGAEALKAVGLPEFTTRLGQLVASSVDLADQTGQTPFIKAAANGHLDVVKALEQRVDPNRRDRQGKTALMLAAAAGDAQMVEHLASLNQLTIEQIQAADKEGKTALDLATAGGHKDVMLVLRQPTLVKAAGAGQMALVRSIFEDNEFPELNAADALKSAAQNGATPVVRYFLEKWKGKPIEERQRLVGLPVNGFEGTALSYASANGHKQTVEALLDPAWWGDKAALLGYITAIIYGNATAESWLAFNPQRAEMVALLKAKREALEAELKK
jgi:ankyrin repeat protein